MEETERNGNKRNGNEGKRPYIKPEMKVEKIHRFFFAKCQMTWPFCYSANVTYPLQSNCR